MACSVPTNGSRIPVNSHLINLLSRQEATTVPWELHQQRYTKDLASGYTLQPDQCSNYILKDKLISRLASNFSITVCWFLVPLSFYFATFLLLCYYMSLLVEFPQSSDGRIRIFPCRHHSTVALHILCEGWTIARWWSQFRDVVSAQWHEQQLRH
jgi:hypothetical protein